MDYLVIGGVITRAESDVVPRECVKFIRARFNTEIHSKEYHGTRTTTSCHVAVRYQVNDAPKDYFGHVDKFFRVFLRGQTHKLSLVSCFVPLQQTRYNTVRLTDAVYKTGRIVAVTSIDRKVILHRMAANQTWVLEVPRSRSH